MSDGNSNINFYANATQLLQELTKIAKKQQEQIDNFEKAGKSSRKAMTEAEKATAAAAKEMQKFARSTTDINKTPLERYRDEMQRLDAAFKAGNISQVTFNRATERAKGALDAAKAAAASTKETVKTTFGASAIESLRGYAAGMVTVGTAVAVVRSAMELMRQETDAAVASVNNLTQARMGLNQVGTSDADISERNAFADTLAMKYGVPRNKARELVMAARSEGFEGTEVDIARLHAANVVTPETAITAAGMVRSNMNRFNITPQSAIVGTMIGGEVSRASIEKYAAELPKLTGAVEGIGATPAETMATVAVLASKNERAAEYTATLANSLGIMKEFKGKGLLGATEILEKMPEAKRQKFLGTSKEMNTAYGWLVGERDKIKAAQATIETGMASPESYISRKEQETLFSDTLEARLRRSQLANEKARITREISQEQRLGEYGFNVDTAITEEMGSLEQSGANPFRRLARWTAMNVAKEFRASPTMVRDAGQLADSTLTGAFRRGTAVALDPSGGGAAAAYEGITGLLSRLTSASEKLDTAADNLERATDNSGRQRAAAGITPE